MNKIQVILIVFAIIIAIVGVFVFSRTSNPDTTSPGTTDGKLVVWGTIPRSTELTRILSEYQSSEARTKIEYRAVDPRIFDRTVIDALATGEGPDVVIADIDWIRGNRDKLQQAPTSFTTLEYQNVFVDLAVSEFIENILLDDRRTRKDFIWAMPLWVDPLVMYWNKDLFNGANVALPPSDWTQLKSASNAIKIVSQGGLVERAGISFGRSRNVPNFKDIMTLLLVQQGKDIENSLFNLVVRPFSEENSIVRLYTDFGRIGSPTYTWNNNLPSPRDAFANGALGIMFDNLSYETELRAKNPHLSFGIAPTPQIEKASLPIYTANIVGIAVPITSEEKLPAWLFAKWLSDPEQASRIIESFSVAPARRDLLEIEDVSDFIKSITLNSKRTQESFPQETEVILGEAIESITNGQQTISEALEDAGLKFRNLR
ncbi:MAG: extracellular solute-binding protein [bacterium]|nr:extracellular solute-binding protein [bacterium]